jgi:hypothetical protein
MSGVLALLSYLQARKSADASAVSATASSDSADTARDALQENRRQYELSITPHLFLQVENEKGGSHVYVCNAGPGAALNVHAHYTDERQNGRTEEREYERAYLLKGDRCSAISKIAVNSYRRAWGTIECEDVDHNNHIFTTTPDDLR